MRQVRGLFASLLVLTLLIAGPSHAAAADAPAGEMIWGVHISLAPTWFDPAEPPGSSRPSW
jgi:peptide/nickel transport system substrate-binding protein